MGLSRTCHPATLSVAAIAWLLGANALARSTPDPVEPTPISIDARVQGAGSIKGTVTLSGTAAPETIKVTVDEAICGRTQPDPSLTIGEGGTVADAVLMLSGTKSSYTATPAVVNRQCRFTPHVQIGAPKSTLAVKSEDQTIHTTHAYGRNDKSLFNVAIPIPGIEIKQALGDSTIVRLVCDTHPWMRGYVILTDQIAAVSGPGGTFVLENVPAGSYDLTVWHEKLKGAPQKVTVTAGQATPVQIALTR